jgi:hypothetical protein
MNVENPLGTVKGRTNSIPGSVPALPTEPSVVFVADFGVDKERCGC